MKMARLFSLTLAMLMPLAGCDFPGRPNPANRPVSLDKIVDFAKLYGANCAGCHGADGTLGPAPPLNDPLFLTLIPEEEIERLIARGRPGTPMGSFAHEHGGTLTPAQVKALAVGLKANWKTEVTLKAPLPTYFVERDPASSSTEALERGKKAFARACASCHGEDGVGTDGAGTLHDPVFLGLVSDQLLRRTIIVGRADLEMPNFADGQGRSTSFQPLTPTEINDLVALLGSWREPLQPTTPAEKPAEAKTGTQP